MGLENIPTLISTVGFPIFCCIALGVYVKYQTDKNDERLKTTMEQHKEEMKGITEALNNNTVTLQKLHDFLSNKEALS